MRARHFIVEYDRTKTAQAFTSKLVNQALADPTVPGAVKNNIKTMNPVDAAELILKNQIEIGDPTKQKKFAQALALKYANGLIKWEDVTSTLKDYLAKFFKLGIKKKLKPEHSDFNRYKDLKTFYDAVDTYPDPDEEDQKKQAEKEANKGNAKLHYEDSTIRVIVPKDEAAACYYGQGTRWCTAAHWDNRFDEYNNKGPMYIIIPKKPKYAGEKYQLHLQMEQFMDEKDEPIILKDLVKRFPGILNVSQLTKDAEKLGLVMLLSDEGKENLRDTLEKNMKEVSPGVYTTNIMMPGEDANRVNKKVINILCTMFGLDWDWNSFRSEEEDFYMAWAVTYRTPDDEWDTPGVVMTERESIYSKPKFVKRPNYNMKPGEMPDDENVKKVIFNLKSDLPWHSKDSLANTYGSVWS